MTVSQSSTNRLARAGMLDASTTMKKTQKTVVAHFIQSMKTGNFFRLA